MAKAVLGSNVFSTIARPLRRFLAGEGPGAAKVSDFGRPTNDRAAEGTYHLPMQIDALDHDHPKNPSNSTIPKSVLFPGMNACPCILSKEPGNQGQSCGISYGRMVGALMSRIICQAPAAPKVL